MIYQISCEQAQLERELAAAHIPAEIIRPYAGKRWLTNGGIIGGTGKEDWLAAEKELRDKYRDHYLACYFD